MAAAAISLAAFSPLLNYRDAIYITAGFAGVLGFVVLLFQPLLSGGFLGLRTRGARRLHAGLGALLVLLVVIHVATLWITSPPDVIDALTFASPTAFSPWGVVGMWALFLKAILALLRRPLRLRPNIWTVAHRLLAVLIVICTILHALLIDGTMETLSKVVLCAGVALASLAAVLTKRPWASARR